MYVATLTTTLLLGWIQWTETSSLTETKPHPHTSGVRIGGLFMPPFSSSGVRSSSSLKATEGSLIILGTVVGEDMGWGLRLWEGLEKFDG